MFSWLTLRNKAKETEYREWQQHLTEADERTAALRQATARWAADAPARQSAQEAKRIEIERYRREALRLHNVELKIKRGDVKMGFFTCPVNCGHNTWALVETTPMCTGPDPDDHVPVEMVPVEKPANLGVEDE